MSAWQESKARNKKDIVEEVQKEGKQFIVQRLWTSVVLRGDVLKNDSGSCAVFTEQGSNASYMTAGKE